MGWGPSVTIPDVVETEPAEFVQVITTTPVDAPNTEPGVCAEGLLLSVEAGVTEAPTVVTVGTDTADLGVDEASGTGTKAVNVVEKMKADPAEFINVVTKTELAVLREGLGRVEQVVTNIINKKTADSVSMSVKLFDDSPADVGFGTSKVTDV